MWGGAGKDKGLLSDFKAFNTPISIRVAQGLGVLPTEGAGGVNRTRKAPNPSTARDLG